VIVPVRWAVVVFAAALMRNSPSPLLTTEMCEIVNQFTLLRMLCVQAVVPAATRIVWLPPPAGAAQVLGVSVCSGPLGAACVT